LRVVVRHDEGLFRQIVDFSRERFATDKASYHISATLADVPPSQRLATAGELETHYLQCWADVPPGAGFTHPGRQILHCTFGSVLADPRLGTAVRQVLQAQPASYAEVLEDHFARHLQALQAGL
jgi:hypothetical protein